ncbi:MAG: hypothetical protein MI753_03375 [Hyphomicrobiales bacterium]|nr:hypothetical protein [Hyphomicrobiales bacterium]
MARVETGAARSRQRLPSFEQFQLIGLLIGVAWIGPRTYAAFTSPSIGLIADAARRSFNAILRPNWQTPR